jgi:hypothetical protein
MPKRSSKKKADEAQQAPCPTPEEPAQPAAEPATEGKNPAAVALGRLGGKKGGPARAASLSAKNRREIAKKAAAARWKNR